MRRPNRWDFNYKGHKKLDEVKLELCHIIRRIQAQDNISQKLMAFYLGTSQSNVSLVSRKRLKQLTVNQLFRYLVLLRPDFEMLISI